jgi:NADPH:quinone reductase-like Zn-dependent oxidoreductase
MKAVIIKERGKPALAEIKEQSMRPGYVKVKTAAVAINPSEIQSPRLY